MLDYDKYAKFIDPKLFRDPNGIHGICHTTRVLVLVLKIAELMGQSKENDILAASAIYHDIGRTHDGKDYTHGTKSVEKLKSIGFPSVNTMHISQEDLPYVQFLIESHAMEDEDGLKIMSEYKIDPIRAVCLFNMFKDADGLDRIRLGISGDLNPNYLRTVAGIELIDFAKDLYKKRKETNEN
jgi:putative nucleotidyltransferase with HDIG domain